MAIILLLFCSFSVFFDIHDERLKPIGKELPGEDLPLVESGEELVQTLQDGRPVHGHHVELTVEAPQQCLDCLVMDRAQVDSGTLRNLKINIVRLK